MPLLMCPNDNAAMTTLQRDGVEFDMCPTCRGVWLDRGELEKLMAAGRGPTPQAAPPPAQPWGNEPRRYEEGRRRDYDDDDDRHYRKKRHSIFDIFD